MKLGVLSRVWREFVADPELVCALSIGNLASLLLLLFLELSRHWGGR